MEATPGYRLTIDLPAQMVTGPTARVSPFQVDASRKECLLNGWDDIGPTLRHHADKIAFRREAPNRTIGLPDAQHLPQGRKEHRKRSGSRWFLRNSGLCAAGVDFDGWVNE